MPRSAIAICLASLFTIGFTASAYASFQPVESIRDAALAAAGASPQRPGEATIDAALQLPACAKPLKGTPVSASTVEVSCPDSWRLFVPVKIQQMQPVLVLAVSASSGQPLTADQLRVEMRDARRMGATPLTDPMQALGKTLRRPMRAGMLLSAGDLQSADAVLRGEPVTIVSRGGGLEVRVAGKALGNAAMGEAVAVENSSSRRVVRGMVVAQGIVQIAR